MSEAVMIPQPKTYGPLGNLPSIDQSQPILSMGDLAKEYGPIYRLTLPGFTTLIVTGHKLVAEVCDITRFDKEVSGVLENVRVFAGDGLFTSRTTEPNWRKAHNILLPTFSQQAMKGYHDMMVDIASQLVQKWARLNPNETIDVADDMTRLTLDTIGICGFNYRFNSFYKEKHSPFIESMVRALNEAMHKSSRLAIQNMLMVKTRQQFQEDIQTMFSLVDKIIEERKRNGDRGEADLLARMLHGKDPETGEGLDDENIRYQIITFLIAGHETTSGLLSFALYYLLKNESVLQKAYEEVDRVMTTPIPQYEQVQKLKYIRLVLNEALRLWPTAPGFDLFAREDTVIGGMYPVKKGETVSVILPQLHRDKDAWGEDAEEFRPERFSDPAKVPHHAYKPFGNGERACIGMQFALYEATLVLGMILQNFRLVDYANYQLKVAQTLTIKPDGFTIRVRQRTDRSAVSVPADKHREQAKGNAQAPVKPQAAKTPVGATAIPLLVLYGSNLGTAEGKARELADAARQYGFASEVGVLNDWAGKLPTKGAVLIVTASYNGRPPRNAAGFVKWLEQVQPGELAGVQFAVLGCGDRNWSNTYQSVPVFIDEQLAKKGGTRLSGRGEADAGGDFEKQVDDWRETMWNDLTDAFGLHREEQAEGEQTELQVQFVAGHPTVPLAEAYDCVQATVLANRELQQPGSGRSTRHIELALPAGVIYQEGDHIGILPNNRPEIVERILRRFRLQGTEQLILRVHGRSAVHLPLDRPVSLRDLLSTSVEVQEAATRAQLRALAACTVCPPHKRELETLLDETVYAEQVLKKRLTMLELLEKYEACELPFAKFLDLLPPLRPRYYSISSSPMHWEDQASLTVAVVNGPAWSGQGQYHGVASTFLAERSAGEKIWMFVRTPESGFQLPENPLLPIVMVGPGTGIAPFRGFLQARAALKEQGVPLGEAHLYFGCRNELDFLYREELEQYQRDGIVTLHTAFSRSPGMVKTYVQHLLEQDDVYLVDLLDNRGRLYVCGDGTHMAPDVEATVLRIYQRVRGADPAEAQAWLEQLQAEGRYAKDVWSRT
ncbi:cytochrome P450/NADPH-cytochrome P450 reductase [Brevibacillus sp. 1238]|nr:cytochrome P450/NADPH-cytochrome P450 reductase [Brevibacillus sp. 1238]